MKHIYESYPQSYPHNVDKSN